MLWYLGFRVSRDDSETGQQAFEVREYDALSAQVYEPRHILE